MAINESQQKPALAALQNSLTMIQGPPGTGNTYLIAQRMKKLVDNGERVLCMSSSHVSVKEMFNAVKSVGVPVLRRCNNEEDGNELWQSGRQCHCLCITLQSSLFSATDNFSTWIVDESSQLSDIDLFFHAQHLAEKRVVVVGDYKQNQLMYHTVSFQSMQILHLF